MQSIEDSADRGYDAQRLCPGIIDELERLGCEIDSPERVPEPRYVRFGDQRVAVPEAYRQLVEDVRWPDAELRGQMGTGLKYWGLRFFDDLQPFRPADLGYDFAGMDSVHYLHIGYKDSGNWLLLLRLDESDPTNPRWSRGATRVGQHMPDVFDMVVEATRPDIACQGERYSLENRRVNALEALPKFGEVAREALPRVRPCLDDGSAKVRKAAKEVMKQLTTT